MVLLFGIKNHPAHSVAADANAGKGGVHQDGAERTLRPVGDVQRVHSMKIISSFMGEGVHIESSRSEVYDRRAGDADFVGDVGELSAIVACAEIEIGGHRRNAQVGLP